MTSRPTGQGGAARGRDDLGAALEALTDGVIIFDAGRRVKAFNARYCEIFGLSGDEIRVGDTLEGVIRTIAGVAGFGPRPGTLDEIVRARLAAWGTEGDRFERRSLHDGRTLDIVRTRTSTGDIVSLHIDVTERVRAERELERQRDYMVSLLENISDGACMFDADGHFIMSNIRFLELYDIDQTQVRWGMHYFELARHFGDLDGLSAERREAEVVKRYGFVSDPSRTRVVRSLFNGRTVEVVKALLPQGGSVLTMRDVTDELNARRALEEERRRAEDSSRHKSRFLARMSHEMRTPLNGILGIGALLSRTKLDTKQAHFVDVIRGSGKILLRLIDDLLDTARVEAETFDLVVEPFALGEIVNEALAVVAPAAREKGLALVQERSGPPLPPLMGDPVRVKQVLLNLLSNAVKFTDRGEVAVRIEAALGVGSAQVRLSVRDTGIGIAQADQQRIFEQFFQVEEHEQRRYGGVGLGLAISARLVRSMGGSIQVRSALGAGATFTIDLPFEIAEDDVIESGVRPALTPPRDQPSAPRSGR